MRTSPAAVPEAGQVVGDHVDPVEGVIVEGRRLPFAVGDRPYAAERVDRRDFRRLCLDHACRHVAESRLDANRRYSRPIKTLRTTSKAIPIPMVIMS
jgi:hypothetical protein